ncbi:MAG: HAD-IC family P-type ATPase [Candidatus Heimdallarchaeota archaeon]|nr:HAD-IC family P-type ATPase [Candidatus Heimdallarchaeota archaeon]
MTDDKEANNNSLGKTNREEILSQLENPWRTKKEKITELLQVDPKEGLTTKDARQKRKMFGSNELKRVEKKSVWKILFDQVKSILIAFLVVASVLSFVFGEIVDGTAIIIVIFINTAIGFFTEYRAQRAIESLYELTKVKSTVRRNGKTKKISADKLVLGDIIVLKTGDIIPADARIIDSSTLQVDEASLTGESVPIAKEEKIFEKQIPLADRKNMLYKGTAITRGSGEGVVVAIGEDTEIGKISTLVKRAKKGETPLTRRLAKLGRELLVVTLVIAAVIFGVGFLRGKELILMIESSTALAVATVPEGLPIVATVALARGMWRMANKNAIINRLSAVEALGSTNIICVDKTGTLTENQMTVTKIILHDRKIKVTGRGLSPEGEFFIDSTKINPAELEPLHKIIQVGIFCNDAEIQQNGAKQYNAFGDPIEAALLILGGKADIWREDLLAEHPQVKLEPFDVKVKMMGTINKFSNRFFVSVKGAPEVVLDACNTIETEEGVIELTNELREDLLQVNKEMAEDGFRVIGCAYKETESADVDLYEKLTFLGLVDFLDPPREEVKPAIIQCKNAGIKIVMVTGDQAATAKNIARNLSLADEPLKILNGEDIKKIDEMTEELKKEIKETDIFARFTPEQKLELIDVYQSEDAVVAMTGDGVNDAPALEKANIGVAMGQRGTQVAKEASDMIIKDDNFQTITYAVEEGRIIANNIRKFVMFLLSCNLSEMLLIFIPSILNLPLLITPLQILFLNLITDIFPAFALAVCRGEQKIMEQPPRPPDEPILTKKHWTFIITYGTILTIPPLASFFILSGITANIDDYVLTITFLVLAFTQLWHAFNMRQKGSNIIKNEITTNIYMWLGIALSIILLIIGTYLPGLKTYLQTTNPGVDGWLLIIGISLIPLVIGQLWISFSEKLIQLLANWREKKISNEKQ